jgi:hypothetical protein
MMQRRMHVAILKLKNEMRIVTAEYRSRNKTKKCDHSNHQKYTGIYKI